LFRQTRIDYAIAANNNKLNSIMKSFVQGSEATAARRDQYQRHIFSFTSTNVVQSKCVTQICFVTAIFSVFLNCYCSGNTNFTSKL